jgi:hypothetical protein
MCGLKEGKRVKLKTQVKFDVVAIHVVFVPIVLVLLVDKSLCRIKYVVRSTMLGVVLFRCYVAMKYVIQVLLYHGGIWLNQTKNRK